MNKIKENNLPRISRRQFVGMTATGTAAISILPSYTVSGLGHVVPSDKLYIASVGCGGKGASTIQIIQRKPKKNFVISHLCDVDDRQAAPMRKEFPKAPFYYDWREMFEKESKNFDAVIVSTPDHNHAIIGLSTMQLNKHLYLEKPIAHDIYEARILTQAEKKYQVICQMGDQGASSEGMQTLRKWLDVGLLGDIETVYCWTDRPVWPQGIPWPKQHSAPPKELKWDLWLGTAQETEYIDNLAPFNWRGWWKFGTGALGDMGCHIMGPPFKLLGLEYPTEVSGSASTVYNSFFEESQFHESGPVSSSIKFKFDLKNGKKLDLYWMDGGIIPERLNELAPDMNMHKILSDYPEMKDCEGGTIFIGTKGKAACGWGGRNPLLLPLSLNRYINKVPQQREDDVFRHYWQWIDACFDGYGKAEVSSPFEGYAGPLTESVLMGNLLLRSFNIREKIKRTDPVYGEMEGFIYPGRYIEYKWDGENMRITNFEQGNQFVKREYRKGWGELKL